MCRLASRSELSDKEPSDPNDENLTDECEVAEIFRIETNMFDFETLDLLTKDIMGFKTYEDYKDDWIYEWNENVPWDVLNGQLVVGERMVIVMEEIFPVLTLLETSSITKTLNGMRLWKIVNLKKKLLRNKAIMEGLIEEDDDESRYERRRRWNVIFEMIKYSFGQDKEYVSIKEKEYDDLMNTCNDACQAYQEIFRMMDEGWMVTRAE
ncbi:hypothetical protein Tco_0471616 [Tanacetum coccineum]